MNDEQVKELLNSLENEVLAEIQPGTIQMVIANGGFKKLLVDSFIDAKKDILKIIDEAFLEDYPNIASAAKEIVDGLIIYFRNKFKKEQDNDNEIKE